MAKAAGALGQTFAGAVLADDLVAFGVFGRPRWSRPDTSRHVRLLRWWRPQLAAGCAGRPGPGMRGELHDGHLRLPGAGRAGQTHSWLLHVPGLWSLSDWPDLTAMGRARFLAQYRTDDELFPLAGMRAAHLHLLALHAGTTRYRGSFHPGGHSFDIPMQEEAWAYLAEAM